MDVEHHDLATPAWQTLPGGVVHKEQSLVGVLDRERAGKLGLALAPGISVRPTGVLARFAEDVGRGGLSQGSVVVQVEDFDTAIAISRDEQPTMDALQRPLGRSPNAVTGCAPVGHATDEGRISPDVLLSELIGCRLAISLCV